MLILKNIAIGSALIHGRTHVNDYDLAQVRHIALSSGTPERRPLWASIRDTLSKNPKT